MYDVETSSNSTEKKWKVKALVVFFSHLNPLS